MRITRLTLCILAALRRVTPLRLAPRWQPALRLRRYVSRKSVAVDVAPEPPAEPEKVAPAPVQPIHPATGLGVRAIYDRTLVGRLDVGVAADPIEQPNGDVVMEPTVGVYIVFGHAF